MAEQNGIDRRAKLLQNGGLHPRLADLIRAIDRLEADGQIPGRPMAYSYRGVLRARDDYLVMLLADGD